MQKSFILKKEIIKKKPEERRQFIADCSVIVFSDRTAESCPEKAR